MGVTRDCPLCAHPEDVDFGHEAVAAAEEAADDDRKVPRAPYKRRNHPARFVSAHEPAVRTDVDHAR
jgi:hypothetical protein